MKVMILAAGRGARMRELTAQKPKPLLEIGGQPMIVRLLKQLRNSGFTDFVINHAWQGQKLVTALGNGSQWGVSIRWSAERVALETAGGIAHALPLLGDNFFAVVNGDIFTDFNFAGLNALEQQISRQQAVGGCILVPNPVHHPAGDFTLTNNGFLHPEGNNQLTYSGIGVFKPSMFAGIAPGIAAPLGPLIRQFAANQKILARLHDGLWSDVGTPERLNEVNQLLKNGTSG
ncbi:MAG: nucleotidyltransferase family protein [Burkholderiaceae bacterium]